MANRPSKAMRILALLEAGAILKIDGRRLRMLSDGNIVMAAVVEASPDASRVGKEINLPFGQDMTLSGWWEMCGELSEEAVRTLELLNKD